MEKKTINLEMSHEQFKALAQLVYLGEYVAAFQDIEEESEGKYDAIEQYIYSYAKDFGLEEWVEYSDEHHRFFPTMTMEEELLDILEEYEESSFWDTLCLRMAERDVADELGIEDGQEIESVEWLNEVIARSDDYLEEFEENGIKNLALKKD